MALFGFKDRATVNTLKRIADTARYGVQRTNGPGYAPTWEVNRSGGDRTMYPARKLPSTRVYMATVNGTIPAGRKARIDGQWRIIPGKGTACIHQRNRDDDGGINEMMERLDEAGEAVLIEVWNLYPYEISGSGGPQLGNNANDAGLDCDDPMIAVTQDQWGDFYIVENYQHNTCDQSSSSTSEQFSSDSTPPSLSTFVSSSSSTSEPPSEPPSESSTSVVVSSDGSISVSVPGSSIGSVSGGSSVSDTPPSSTGSFSGVASSVSLSLPSVSGISGSSTAESISGSESTQPSESGSVSGSVSGSIDASGSISGSILGSVSGSISGSIGGSISGSISGIESISGSISESTDLSGSISGSFSESDRPSFSGSGSFSTPSFSTGSKSVSVSSSGSGEQDCIEVVTDVSFDTETCSLTVTKRRICCVCLDDVSGS